MVLEQRGQVECTSSMIKRCLTSTVAARSFWAQCRELRLHSQAPLTVHIDGEFFARPEDDVRDLEVRLLPRRLRVQTTL